MSEVALDDGPRYAVKTFRRHLLLPGMRPAQALEDVRVAFLDIVPANPGHCLVVPRTHHPNLWEISAEAYMVR
jgi:diadenosine tetraphosphate (Ap4A) HIT family hydrolase